MENVHALLVNGKKTSFTIYVNISMNMCENTKWKKLDAKEYMQ